MIITRVINGQTVEIELTRLEMVQAAEAIREDDRRNYIKNQIQNLDDDDDRAILKQLEGEALVDAVDGMLIDFELLVDDHGYDWCDAWEQVSDDCVAKMADEIHQGEL